MAVNIPAVKGVLSKLEAADLQILAESLVPALVSDAEGYIPVKYQAVDGLINLIEPPMQEALGNLIAKIVPAPSV